MKQFLKKPLGLAVAATMAMGGLAVYSSASATTDAAALGDLALVPYYTVRGDFVTGVHIINSSESTQVVKLRLRRGTDSADALDFNLIMSPHDEWTGTINDTADQLGISSGDKTCTAPAANGTDPSGKPKFIAPNIFKAGADEGYLEVIGMAQTANETDSLPVNAVHVNGTPVDCDKVRENFRAVNVVNPSQTKNNAGATTDYVDTPNALKVSYFIRDVASGMEMGDNATHIKDFQTATFDDDNDPATPNVAYPFGGAMITNQQSGLNSGDTAGFDFPDLDGGVATQRGRYISVIRADLGANSILNDWSFNSANGVSTDWAITIPGQYLMDDPADNGMLVVNGTGDATNHRDLPVTAAFQVYDREEGSEAPGGLVISPSPAAAETDFTEEVNVVEWGGQKVFNTAKPTTVSPSFAAKSGWADLAISSKTAARRVYDLTDTTGATFTNVPVDSNVPVIGFTAWQRTFAAEANKNYGRIIAHSRR